MNEQRYMPAEIGEDFYEALGRIVIKFARLDDSLAMSIFTLMSDNPVNVRDENITTLSGPVDQMTFRHVISGIDTMQRLEILKRLAKSKFPNKDKGIAKICNLVEKKIKERNILVHQKWYKEGQIGFDRYSKFLQIKRTPEELQQIGNQIARLDEAIMDFHSYLLGIEPEDHYLQGL